MNVERKLKSKHMSIRKIVKKFSMMLKARRIGQCWFDPFVLCQNVHRKTTEWEKWKKGISNEFATEKRFLFLISVEFLIDILLQQGKQRSFACLTQTNQQNAKNKNKYQTFLISYGVNTWSISDKITFSQLLWCSWLLMISTRWKIVFGFLYTFLLFFRKQFGMVQHFNMHIHTYWKIFVFFSLALILHNTIFDSMKYISFSFATYWKIFKIYNKQMLSNGKKIRKVYTHYTRHKKDFYIDMERTEHKTTDCRKSKNEKIACCTLV